MGEDAFDSALLKNVGMSTLENMKWKQLLFCFVCYNNKGV